MTSIGVNVRVRQLASNKGVILSGVHPQNGPSQVIYPTRHGTIQTLTIPWENEREFHAHVDDDTNEILVLQNIPFRY